MIQHLRMPWIQLSFYGGILNYLSLQTDQQDSVIWNESWVELFFTYSIFAWCNCRVENHSVVEVKIHGERNIFVVNFSANCIYWDFSFFKKGTAAVTLALISAILPQTRSIYWSMTVLLVSYTFGNANRATKLRIRSVSPLNHDPI